jgi:RHS repeat-associated protein
VNGAVTRLYVHGDRVDEPWVEYVGAALGTAGRRYLLADHQGSIIGRIDTAGGSLKKLAYDSFGIPQGSNEGRFGYTGQLWLRELGLLYYKARVYSPALGRFLQTDPAGYKEGLNLYHYVSNDPLTKIDPTGLGEKEFEQLARSKPQPKCTNPEACATLRTMATVSSIALLAPFVWEAGWWAFLHPAQATTAAVVAGEAGIGIAAGPGPGPASVTTNVATTTTKVAIQAERLLANPILNGHHLMPNQFRSFFGKAGINIDDHAITLSQSVHLRGVHGSGFANMPGRWNKQWAAWIEANPNATDKEIYQQLGRMMDDFGIGGARVHPYGE